MSKDDKNSGGIVAQERKLDLKVRPPEAIVPEGKTRVVVNSHSRGFEPGDLCYIEHMLHSSSYGAYAVLVRLRDGFVGEILLEERGVKAFRAIVPLGRVDNK